MNRKQWFSYTFCNDVETCFTTACPNNSFHIMFTFSFTKGGESHFIEPFVIYEKREHLPSPQKIILYI